MTDIELDLEIARDVMGFTLEKCHYPCGLLNTYNIAEKDGICIVGHHWRPSRDLNHAWEVVARLGLPFYLQLDGQMHTAAFKVGDDQKVAAEDMRPARAICLAALEAISKVKPCG